MNIDFPIKRRKKLIEVAIPLEIINAASVREKSIRHGHPSTLHLWWARRPLAASRGIIFCQLVDDPSSIPEEFPTIEAQCKERERLFKIIEDLILWENSNNRNTIDKAQEEIKKCWERCCKDNIDHPNAFEIFNPDKLPAFHDPFAGGGSIPLEAQRLGLNSYASDINPVATLINKATIEIPQKFSNLPSLNSYFNNERLIDNSWAGADGLADDIRYYGKWISKKAEESLNQLFPKIKINSKVIEKRPDLAAYQEKNLNVICWIWARTVKSPNPSFNTKEVPLISNFIISKKKGNEAYIEVVLKDDNYYFVVHPGKPENIEKASLGTSAGKRASFKCLFTGDPIPYNYIRNEGRAGRIGKRLIAIVAEGKKKRIYLSPTKEHEDIVKEVTCIEKPDLKLPYNPRDFKTPNYGLESYGDLFTERQLLVHQTFCKLIEKVRFKINEDQKKVFQKENKNLDIFSNKYAESICVYLSFSVSRLINRHSTVCIWNTIGEKIEQVFAKQAIPMRWDFPEANPLSKSSGGYEGTLEWIPKVLELFPDADVGVVEQEDAATQKISNQKIISTDPPYYDNIGYADLSDYFYLWLRKNLKGIYPELFSTISTPKTAEIISDPYRHRTQKDADKFFLSQMTQAMKMIAFQANKCFPITIYYAYKQSEKTSQGNSVSTGWETFLEAVFSSGLELRATWPVRTERPTGIKSSTNSLASSLVLVCQAKSTDSTYITRKDFIKKVKKKLGAYLKDLNSINIAPVDVAQSMIGPGMEIFSQSKAVLNPDDSHMTVREALIEINNVLDESLTNEEIYLDSDSRFAVTFFESFGYEQRPYGDAEGLAKARNVSVEGIAEAGILNAFGGKVKLLRRDELDKDWDPTSDKRLCIWEATQHLIRKLETEGEVSAASILSNLKRIAGYGDLANNCRALSYRLFNFCEKNNMSEEARSYNSLIIAWPELERIDADQKNESTIQTNLI